MRSVPRSFIAAAALWMAALGSALVAATDPSGTRPASGQPDICRSGRQARGGHPDRRCDRASRRVAPATSPTRSSSCTRISFQRNTPEGWQTTIQRMAALNGLQIDPQTARHVVRYLSNNLGLGARGGQARRVRSRSAGLPTTSTRPMLMPKASARSAIRWVASSRSAGRAKSGTC